MTQNYQMFNTLKHFLTQIIKMRKKMKGYVTQSFAGLKADPQSQENFLKRQFYRKIDSFQIIHRIKWFKFFI